MMTTRRFRRAATGALAATLLLSGCGMTLQSLPLPGVISGPTYKLTAIFPDALGLPDQAPVKMGGLTIGQVSSIVADNYSARVELRIRKVSAIPAGTHAEVRMSSPMGDAFVDLEPPANPTGPSLADGATIPLSATSSAPSATDLLASLSTLISGGTFSEMKVILSELDKIMNGNGGNIRALIAQATSLTHELNAHTAQFDAALAATKRLTDELSADSPTLAASLQAMAPAVDTLTQNTQQIVTLSTHLEQLANGTNTLLGTSKPALVSTLADLHQILDTLTQNAGNFQKIYGGIRDFGQGTNRALYGLFENFDLTAILSPTGAASNLLTNPPAVP